MSAALQFPALALVAAAQRQAAMDRHNGAHRQLAAAGSQPAPAPSPERAPAPASPLRGFGPQSEHPAGAALTGAAHIGAQFGAQPAHPDPHLAPNHNPHGRSTPVATLAFYRKHTETLLRRFLYASMLIGRSPSMLKEPIVRGFASHQPVETFEDSVIFVLDMESALARLTAVDRHLLTRIVLQEYSIAETALLLNKRHRFICIRLAEALDRLTRILLDNGTLKMPHKRKPDKNLHG